MSDNSSDQEPSIEEILASIRQIISDDDEETPAEEGLDNPVRDGTDDVLELTEDDLVDDTPEPEEEPEPEIEFNDIEEPEEEPEPVFESEPEMEEEPVYTEPEPSIPSDIMSSGTQAVAMDAISKLANKMPINRPRSYDGITLEDIVREMLNPMLREWMDDNLPPMVERIVQKELEKLARRAFDD